MPAKKQRVEAVLELLCQKFPRTFFMFEVRRVPLKIGFTKELEAILDETVDRKTLRLAMKYYTCNIGYLHAQRRGAPRIDLTGNDSGEVSEEEAKGAKARIAARKAKAKPPASTKPPAAKHDGLSALREAARKRRQASASIGGEG